MILISGQTSQTRMLLIRVWTKNFSRGQAPAPAGAREQVLFRLILGAVGKYIFDHIEY